MLDDEVNSTKEQKRVDISSEELVNYWAQQLCCSQYSLIHAVIEVGNSYDSVDAYLEMNRLKE